MDTELAVDREMIELNTVAPISLTKCVLPHMMARRQGHIVVTSSIAGKFGDLLLCCSASLVILLQIFHIQSSAIFSMGQ